MMITDQGTIIRTPASDLSVLSRSAGGVIVMRLPEDQYVANFTVVAREEKDDAEDEDGENVSLLEDSDGEIELISPEDIELTETLAEAEDEE